MNDQIPTDGLDRAWTPESGFDVEPQKTVQQNLPETEVPQPVIEGAQEMVEQASNMFAGVKPGEVVPEPVKVAEPINFNKTGETAEEAPFTGPTSKGFQERYSINEPVTEEEALDPEFSSMEQINAEIAKTVERAEAGLEFLENQDSKSEKIIKTEEDAMASRERPKELLTAFIANTKPLVENSEKRAS